jgi:hypothetical protein
MTEDLTAALRAHFGPSGLRAVAPRPGLLADPGLPVQVGPYFLAAEPSERPEPSEQSGDSPLLGTDQRARFHQAADGSVRAALPGTGLPEMAVNAGVEAFAAGLLLLDRLLPAVAAADPDRDRSFAAYVELREGLLALDPSAFAERESWWPRVLDDLRRPLNTDASAAIEYLDDEGDRRIVTATGGPGQPHPEEIAWYRLSAAGVPPDRVSKVYCELQPCFLPGHYCALWMAEAFPTAEFTHRYDYGRTAASREAGVRELMTGLAEL